MQGIIFLKIYKVSHEIFGDSVKTIFTDEKPRNYNNYEDVESDILKLAGLTKNSTKGDYEFNIIVSIGNFSVATYYSYVSKNDRHLTKGYSQSYKDWETVISVIKKYQPELFKTNKSDNKLLLNRTKLYNDKVYRLQKFNDFVCNNLGKTFRLKDSISNNCNGEIEGFEFRKNGKILINCYWQGDSTDGNKFIEFDGGPIRFMSKEMNKYGDYYNHRIEFDLDNINDAILNLLLENCKIK